MQRFKIVSKKRIDFDINIEIQFGERVGHRGWLIGPKLFRPEAYLACVSSKHCEFIHQVGVTLITTER